MRAMLSIEENDIVRNCDFDKLELKGENQPPSRLRRPSPLRNLSRYAVAPPEKFAFKNNVNKVNA